MKVLLEYLNIAKDIQLNEEFKLLERDLSNILNRTHNLNNPVSKFPTDELNHKLETAIARLEAARKGLGLSNRLKNPEDQRKNKSRVMKNLNLLRMIVQQVTQQLAKENQDLMGNDDSFDDEGRVHESMIASSTPVKDHRSDRRRPSLTNRPSLKDSDLSDNPFDSRLQKLAKKVGNKFKRK